MNTNRSSAKGFLPRISEAIGGRAGRAERARIEALLSAAPGEYCAWGTDGSLVLSNGFCLLFGLQGLKTLGDIQSILSPGDAAALEGMFSRLQDSGESFAMHARRVDGRRTLRIAGRRGAPAVDGPDDFHMNIIWASDATAAKVDEEKLRAALAHAEEDRDRSHAGLDMLPFPVWMRDARTEIVWCNRAYAAALDASPATVVAEQKELPLKAGKKSAGTKLPGRALAQEALDTGKPAQALAHIIVSGARRLMRIAEIPLPPANAVLGVAQDITRQEELETDQRRNASANKELLEQLGSAIGIFDADQKLEFYNSSFAQLWAQEESYLNTRPKLGDLMEKLRESRRLPEQADFRKFKQGWLNMFISLIGPHEEMLYLPDGRALRMLAIPHPMGGLMTTFEDVTSHLELESSYNTLVAVQKETLDNLAEGVVVFGGDGRLKLWNPSFARLWKMHPEDLQGQPHITRLLDKMKAMFMAEDWLARQKQLMAQGLDRNVQEGRMERADGSLIMFSTVPLPDGGVLVTHADMTDTARVENALREKNAALETAERLKLDFLANVSYQLRTPLNAIMGFSEILNNEYFGPLNARQGEYTAGIREAGDRLLSLIDDILDLSTIEAGYMTLSYDKVHVKNMMEAIYNLTADWARKERLDVKLVCPGDIGVIDADERRLKQALLNLIRNAIAYTPEGGVIAVEAARTDDRIKLTVRDTGAGIKREDAVRIFEPFERAQAGSSVAASKGRGAGLGLSLVRSIAEMHGGKIELESVEGRGSSFTLILPVDSPDKNKKEKMARPKEGV